VCEYGTGLPTFYRTCFRCRATIESCAANGRWRWEGEAPAEPFPASGSAEPRPPVPLANLGLNRHPCTIGESRSTLSQ